MNSHWYEHRQVRDNRVEAFSSRLWSDHYELRYEARATAIGTFTAPPTKIEEMYSPETFGRSSSVVVHVAA
jgi:uncharacterized protein YfaS (alpha-2-macroglobulin family)